MVKNACCSQFIFYIIAWFWVLPISAQNKIPDDYCISQEETRLFNQINHLRRTYEKPVLKLSASLSYVAHEHVNDLKTNRPDTSICGLSSWSDKGNWKACCYNKYLIDEDCMWDKPKELTTYPYRGYELVMYSEESMHIDSIIKLWAGTRQVLDMILTRKDYQQKKWVCMGVGLNEHYVSVWFGQRADKVGPPEPCATDTVVIAASGQTKDNDEKGYFYLIFGSYDQLQEAKNALKKINKNAFSDTGILTKDNRYRIYIGKYDNLKSATFAKQNLSQPYREAWILKY